MIYKRILRPFVVTLALSLCVLSCDNDDSEPENPTAQENLENKQPLGTSANELLASDTFTSIRIEIAYEDGFRPTQTTIDLIDDFLEARLNKPDGITLTETVVEPSQTGPYDINDIVDIEDEHRTVFNEGDQIGVWMFFSGEESSSNMGNSVVLGTAYRNTSVVLYERTFIELANNSTTPINRSLIETSTLRHEVGHLLGLVNIGTPLTSDHEDTNNLRHCNVEECLMFFETVTNVFNNSNIGSIPDFDPLCIADLQANGGL